MRGSLLAIGIACLFFGMLPTIEVRADSDFKVTLIGTGSPIPRPDRFGPSTLFEAGGQKFLIDAGRGAPVRLWQMKIPPGKIDVLFLTHYHSDHTSGIPDLWLTGWLPPPFGQCKMPFQVIAPAVRRSKRRRAMAGVRELSSVKTLEPRYVRATSLARRLDVRVHSMFFSNAD